MMSGVEVMEKRDSKNPYAKPKGDMNGKKVKKAKQSTKYHYNPR